MARLRATCPDCGDVELTPAAATVRVPVGARSGSLVFRCPCCGRPSTKAIAPAVVAALRTVGVRVQRWRRPAELDEARPAGPRFTRDDLCALRGLLADEARFDEAVAALVSGHR